MKKKVFQSSLITLILLLLVFSSVLAAGATRGEGVDPAHAQLFGTIKYLFNPAGYQMWFTAGATQYAYVTGHSYHIVYQLKVDDPSEWCGPITSRNYGPDIPNRHFGKKVYYKVIDKTLDMVVCP